MRTTGILGNRRGNTLVESALDFGAFLFMLIGVFDFGQFLFVHQTLVERARNAVRYAAANKAGRIRDETSARPVDLRFTAGVNPRENSQSLFHKCCDPKWVAT